MHLMTPKSVQEMIDFLRRMSTLEEGRIITCDNPKYEKFAISFMPDGNGTNYTYVRVTQTQGKE